MSEAEILVKGLDEAQTALAVLAAKKYSREAGQVLVNGWNGDIQSFDDLMGRVGTLQSARSKPGAPGVATIPDLDVWICSCGDHQWMLVISYPSGDIVSWSHLHGTKLTTWRMQNDWTNIQFVSRVSVLPGTNLVNSY